MEKQQITYKGNSISLTANLSAETLQARREWQDILKVLIRNNLQPRLLHQARILLKTDGEIKTFSDKQVQFSTVQSHSRILIFACNCMDCSKSGLPVHHQQMEFTQTHVHWVGDAIQPSHPLSSPSHSAFNLSQHQGLFQWVDSSHQVAKVLEFLLQHKSFQWIFRTDFLEDWLVGSPCCPRDLQESSPTPQFKASILNWVL